VTETETIYNLFRHQVSGRAQRWVLHRAVRCEFCGQPMSRTDRWLYRAYTGHSQWHLIAAHPACADAWWQQEMERRREMYAKGHAASLGPAGLMLLAMMIEEDRRMIFGTPRPGGYDGIIGAVA
jgi:hypothetical protein